MSIYDDIKWVEHKGLKNTGLSSADEWPEGEQPWVIGKTFTPEGKLYPRLTLAFHENKYEGGYSLTCNIKRSSKDWWQKHGIPRSLVYHAYGMLGGALRVFSNEDQLARIKAEGMDIASMVRGRLYRFKARNFSIGVWNPEKKGFIGIRTKWGDRYLFTEYHWETGPPYGTVTPLEDLGIDMPVDIPLMDSLPGSWGPCDTREVKWRPDDPKMKGKPGAVGKWFYTDNGDPCPEGGHIKSNKALFNWLETHQPQEESPDAR